MPRTDAEEDNIVAEDGLKVKSLDEEMIEDWIKRCRDASMKTWTLHGLVLILNILTSPTPSPPIAHRRASLSTFPSRNPLGTRLQHINISASNNASLDHFNIMTGVMLRSSDVGMTLDPLF